MQNKYFRTNSNPALAAGFFCCVAPDRDMRKGATGRHKIIAC
jgi:hypothetical protein